MQLDKNTILDLLRQRGAGLRRSLVMSGSSEG
jgi:hypothetical protein